VDASYVVELLRAGRFGECKAAAGALLRQAGLTAADRAQANLVLSRSLAVLHAHQESLAPAELAAHFARETAAYDLLGHALAHLAAVCQDNRLHKRSASCLEEYFQHFTLYDQSRALEGWVFHLTARCHQALGHNDKAAEYYEKAYRWHRGAHPQQWEQHRAELAWHCLRHGRVARVGELLTESESYLQAAPNDLDARGHYLANAAYHSFMLGDYRAAIDTAIRLMKTRGLAPLRRAQACLILHHSAKAMGMPREAMGIGVLARIQASLARRPDLEEEIIRSMLQLQVQQKDGLPVVEELFRARTMAAQQHSDRASG
jgi:tetratricopeptide (TPR) repeat protein